MIGEKHWNFLGNFFDWKLYYLSLFNYNFSFTNLTKNERKKIFEQNEFKLFLPKRHYFFVGLKYFIVGNRVD